EVRIGVVADDARGEASAIDRCGADPRGATDHVAVGQHETVGRDNDARSGAATAPLLIGRDIEPHDGWADALDNVDDGTRISVEQRLVVGRNGGRGVGIRGGSVEHGYSRSAVRGPAWPWIVRRLIGGLKACWGIWGARGGGGRAAGAVHERASRIRAPPRPPKIGRIAHAELE